MKDRTIAICSKIEELISFLKIEKGKRTAQRLLNRAETLAYTSLPFALNTDYNRVCQEMLPLCNDLMCEKLKVLILRIEMYKKDYVGHATKAKQFVRDFDKIEPTLKQCKETLRFGSNKCDDNNGIRHDKLANVISAAENCVSNLSEQYDLWKQEVKEEKKTDWKSKLWVGIIVTIFSFFIAKIYSIYEDEIKSLCARASMPTINEDKSQAPE